MMRKVIDFFTNPIRTYKNAFEYDPFFARLGLSAGLSYSLFASACLYRLGGGTRENYQRLQYASILIIPIVAAPRAAAAAGAMTGLYHAAEKKQDRQHTGALEGHDQRKLAP